MTLNGVMALILRYFAEFAVASGTHCVKVYVYDVVVKSSRTLYHLLMSFLYRCCCGSVKDARPSVTTFSFSIMTQTECTRAPVRLF